MKVIPKAEKNVNCNDCKYFYITWEEQFPYGCRAMGFKGKQRPSAVVFSISNMSCRLFVPKKKR